MINFIIFIIITILMALIFALTIPSYIMVSYDGSFSVKIKFLYIPIKIFPLPFKTKILKNKKSRLHRKESSKKKSKKSKHERRNLRSLWKILMLSKGFAGKIFKHIRINNICLNAGIRGSDAEDTAIKYAQLNILIINLLPIINSTFRPKKYKINIYPDFPESDNPIEFKISIRLSAILIIYELLRLFFSVLKLEIQKVSRCDTF